MSKSTQPHVGAHRRPECRRHTRSLRRLFVFALFATALSFGAGRLTASTPNDTMASTAAVQYAAPSSVEATAPDVTTANRKQPRASTCPAVTSSHTSSTTQRADLIESHDSKITQLVHRAIRSLGSGGKRLFATVHLPKLPNVAPGADLLQAATR